MLDSKVYEPEAEMAMSDEVGYPIVTSRTRFEGWAFSSPARRSRWSGMSIWNPATWPRRIRRTFLLVFPVAMPIWALLLACSLVRSAARDIWLPVRHFWNAAPKRRRSYY